jgi:acetyl esterase
MFIHGGGFTIGDVPTYDGVCRMLANRLRAVVVSVDYRLGPEHPYPAAVNDCLMAWDWLAEHAPSLAIDPQRIGVMGDSAGGNLSAIVSLLAQQQGKPMPKAQCLVYPTTDLSHQTDSMDRYGQHLGLTRDLVSYFDRNYLPEEEDLKQVTLSPLYADSLQGQPPAVVAVCLDPLHDEGVQYADRLAEAGTGVSVLRYPHLIHGFFGMGGMIEAADAALAEICNEFAAIL